MRPNRLRPWIPIAAVVLIALGVNLDRFGIDLERLAGLDGAPAGIEIDGGGAIVAGRGDADGGGAPLAGGAGPDAPPDTPAWSTTEPNVNLRHVFDGEVNRRSEPVGFHSRPGGEDPPGARVVRVRDGPNRFGVYTADVEVWDAGDGRWEGKFSSLFPDSLSRDEVVAAILNAYRESPNPRAQPFDGPSGLGFRIQGYTSGRGGINTAFPVYTSAR